MTDQPSPPAPVKLEEPIVRGETSIAAVVVRRPTPAAMEGLSLRDVVDMEARAMIALLPKLTEPALTVGEVALMNPADFLALAAEASNFLLPKAVRPDFRPA